MSKNLFNSVQMTKPSKNVFDLSHDVKLSFNMGELVPVCCFECVPGDKFNISCESLIRFSPLISPVMHRMDVTVHYFFVPNRILWPNWENFITNTAVGSPAAIPAHPFVTWKDPLLGPFYTRLGNYLGLPVIPVGSTNTVDVNPFPLNAYQKIYDEFYRDQNLNIPYWMPLNDGDNNGSNDNFSIHRRAWEHDYFTAALPFAQKGPGVDIPLGTVVQDLSVGSAGQFNLPGTGTPAADGAVSQTGGVITIPGTGSTGVVYDPNGTLAVEATTINDLRRAYRLQEWLEKNARGGTRYIENILAHFGVKSSDKRLQRPEYITGMKSAVQISEVLNTTGPTDELPQGNMAGHGVSVMAGKYGSYFCEEHGYILGIMSVMPKTAYMQGVPRHFLKNDQFDYFWPSFAHLGEQEVKNVEIYVDQAAGPQEETFGYVPRYAEYKYIPSRVAGDFATTLDFWHLARKFATPPALNEEFVTCTPRDDIFAVTDPNEQKMYCHFLNKIRAVRPMPVFGTPST